MTRAEFLEEIRSLEAFFEKELSIEQATDWYEEIQDEPVAKLRIAIRNAKKTCKFLPKLSEFLEILSETRIEKVEKEKTECKHCNGSGYILYVKKVLNGNKLIEYSFACTCEECQNADTYNNKNYYVETETNIKNDNYKPVFVSSNPSLLLRYEQEVWR